MCGIFGYVSITNKDNSGDIATLARYAQQRGMDASGIITAANGNYEVYRSDEKITSLIKTTDIKNKQIVMGHSRLVTNGSSDNQPVVRDNMMVLHNGIITNADYLFEISTEQRHQVIDTEIIPVIAKRLMDSGIDIDDVGNQVLHQCEGVVSACLLIPEKKKVILMSNNGSLYVGRKNASMFFCSEKYPLVKIGCRNIGRINGSMALALRHNLKSITETNRNTDKKELLYYFQNNTYQEDLLQYPTPDLKRCTCCILPETMPYITFDSDGVCNYCLGYKPKLTGKNISRLKGLVEKYKRPGADPDCIVPLSGGRDSCYALHLIVNDLGMKPVTYTYDWGMVTDLGRRNISRMCGELGVENIIIAADIHKKRNNIRMNLEAWLKRPHLGMISLLTAGDKHFFQHIETVKKQTGISLNLWGVNPLEATHFKAGFLGIPPAFDTKYIYSQPRGRQLRYQVNRLAQIALNPRYINTSLIDTLTGEYWRSMHRKTDYYHLYDYCHWEELMVDKTLELYGWEKAPDTNTTWRIGDGTAAFYNYIYYTVAGFTEHDTFRSNQIREGQITRQQALVLVAQENMPRYQNIRWYLDTVGVDYERAIAAINKIPKLYEERL